MARTQQQTQAQPQAALEALEWQRVLVEAVIEYNRPLATKPGQQASAARRIAEATRQLAEIDREIAELRAKASAAE